MNDDYPLPGQVTDDTRLQDLDISVRLANVLARSGCVTIGDLRIADWGRMKTMIGMGRNSWREFVAFTVTYGLQEPKAQPNKLALMALRDRFAGLAMQYYLRTSQEEGHEDEGAWTTSSKNAAATHAYIMADAMLMAREQ